MLKIGDAANEKGIPFFASSDLTVSGAELLWTGDRVLTATESLVRMVNGGASMGGATPDENGNLILYASNIYGSVLTVNGIAPDLSGNIIISSGVATVNGIEPDEDGNVEVGTVTSVNGNEPDKNGEVTVDIGVQSVNGSFPDATGAVELDIPQGTVTSVNGEKPDENGAVEIQASDIAGIVTSVNGVAPVDGNVSVSLTTAGLVKFVDGIGPDDEGNVALEAIRSINGEKPDTNGNIVLNIGTGSGDGTVTSVNGIEPVDGNITLEIGDIPGGIASVAGVVPQEGNIPTEDLQKALGTVLSVNNTLPDDNGNVTIDATGTVKSIAGVEPDADGNIDGDSLASALGMVKSVNGVEPDADGNVTISTGEGSSAEGTVKSVNGIEPDADGNVEVNVGVLTVNGIEPDADGNVKITTDSSSGTSINHLVIQRPTSDLALYPYVEASESPDYNDSLEIDLYDDYDGNVDYCKVFNGDSWINIPKSGLGTPFDGLEVEIELSKFEGLSQPYYLRYGWVTSDGAYSNYKGLMFPSVSCAGSSSSSSTNIDTSDFVKSVNGVEPDTDGNVELPSRLTIQRPAIEGALFPVAEASSNTNFSNTLTIDTFSVAEDRDLVLAFDGNSWGVFPEDGMESTYAGHEASIDLTRFEELGIPYYLRFCWLDATGEMVEAWRSMEFPSASLAIQGNTSDGTVTSVDGVLPDKNGNVELPQPRLVIQRPIYDYALYPYVEASNDPDYNDSLEIDLYDDYDGNVDYCKVFNGDAWINIPKSGLGTPFDSQEVEIDLSKFEGLSQPYYLRYGWVTSDGAYTNYKGLMYPASSGITSQTATNKTTLPQGTQQGDILAWNHEWTVQSPAEAFRLILQRPVSDLALFPYLEASNQSNFPDDSIIISPFDNEDDFQYCQIFNGDAWLAIPKSGLGTPFDNMEVAINLAKLKTLTMPCYIRYGWVTSDGAMTNFHAMIFPSSSSSAPATQTISKNEFENLQNKFNKLIEILEASGIDLSSL